MANIDNEFLSLLEKTRQNRREFLKTELETCFIAVERGCFELSVGNTHEAQKELAIASHGVQVLERFLREFLSEVPEVEAQLPALRAALKSLAADIQAAS